MKVANDIYAYVWQGNDNNCNSYVFGNTLTGDKHILIDPGHIVTPFLHEPAFERLSQQIKKDGLKLEDIGLVVLTHAHPDHVEAAPRVQLVSRAPIALHRQDEAAFRNFSAGRVDYYLDEGELVLDNLIKEKLQVYHTPGHSPGQIALYWPDRKALAVGDDIFYHNTGRVDLPGGSPTQLKRSIERLSALDVDYLLCGHPYEGPGVIKGKEAVRENFEFLKKYMFWD